MSENILRFLLLTIVLSLCYALKHLSHNFSLLIDFTCATAKDELEKHPEMRTIAMVELENNFPLEFSREVLKCLPVEVAKIIINPHINEYTHSTFMLPILPKQSMVIYVADEVHRNDIFIRYSKMFIRDFTVVNHLSKHLILSSDASLINNTRNVFYELLNVAQIYQLNRKIFVRSFDMVTKIYMTEALEGSLRENFSQTLFPDKIKNLNLMRGKIYAVYEDSDLAHSYIEDDIRPNCKWTPFVDIVAEKLNARLKFISLEQNFTTRQSRRMFRIEQMFKLIYEKRLDFFFNYFLQKFELDSYSSWDWCFIAPVPDPVSITELILFLPMDKSCWMWLSITIAVSTLIWRISEGHWSFAFGAFSYFMGQAQLNVRIRTNRLTMKILLQILIISIFIFSNGYQSLVTSFMLNPLKLPLLKTVDDIFNSDLKIKSEDIFRELFKDNPKYQRALREDRVVVISKSKDYRKQMVDMHMARIQPCKTNKHKIERRGDGTSFEGIYLVPEVSVTELKDLFTRPFHPYLDIFQEIMDRTFEAGLHQAWERTFYLHFYHKKEDEELKDRKVLDFGLIVPFFLILVFGFGAAFLALLCEIFCKDFISNLTRNYFQRKWKDICRRRTQKKLKSVKNKFEAKIIQVRPASRRNSI